MKTTEEAFNLPDLNRFYEASGFKLADQIYPGLLAYIMYYNPDAFPGLNIGPESLVKMMFALEKYFYSNWIGGKLSFATLSLLHKEK